MQIPTASDREIKGTLRGADVIIGRGLGFNHPLGVQVVCLGYVWILLLIKYVEK